MENLMEQFQGLKDGLAHCPWAYNLIIMALIALLAWISNWIAKHILLHIVRSFVQRMPSAGSEEHKLYTDIVSRLANIIPALVLAGGLAAVPGVEGSLLTVIRSVCSAFIALTSARALCKILDLCDLIYRKRPDAASKPIKGYLQLLKLLIALTAVILMVAFLINRNPLLLLSGLGAMAAVLMLIFQDTILSVVASVQIGSNDMVRLGDWIEMPALNANGTVIEIALHTVKVQNWDNTVTTVPIRKLITDSVKNWRAMQESGGRRIQRSLYIDQRSVRFLDDSEVKRLEDFVLLNDYLEKKHDELAAWNAALEKKGAKPINGRRVTNLGTFRAYVEHYLRNNPLIRQDLTLIVRQLQPGPTGIPLEIYCFSADTRWAVYEGIQSDIFDHLLAILPVFDLRVFQQCSDTSGMTVSSPALLNGNKE